ncbi:hypothetical protein K1Y24_05865 [Mammaliicoccus sciuri]|uniref:hypothetical protein n=1 Tax=Mammaliicoccus sciuri TaxID=1296 RepID=UPI001E560C29|nr:hypothetical protein [Mammaliicoccus sciuri]MCD8801485.1 hypothetical protein [Mammaliicoccus sciuri]MCJ0935683.1 hypothetical protein [Mammaliicoccus sciuri]
MKKIISIITILTIVIVLLSGGLIVYNKYKTLELEKNNLEVKLKNSEEKQHEIEKKLDKSITGNTETNNQTDVTENNQEQQSMNDNSSNAKDEVPDFDNMSPEEIFSYHIKGMDDDNIEIEKGKFELQKGTEYTDMWRNELKAQYQSQ